MADVKSELAVPADLLEAAMAMQPLSKWASASLPKLEAGAVDLRIPSSEETSPGGFLQGGITACLAENAAGYAAATLLGDVRLIQFDINYLAPGVGEAFRAEARITKAGRRQAVVSIEVKSEPDDKLIAVARAVALPAA